MTIRSHVVLGVLTIFLLFFLSWVVTKATAHEGTREQHEFMKPNPPGMEVPKKGTTSKFWSEWYGEHPYIKEPAPKFIFLFADNVKSPTSSLLASNVILSENIII